ncbi:hypothetical protein, partial [Butyricimonas virosa]|uniref:hypothetical protein n=1 Tax=Butyricimonas virosa TaxID=544645 RepID=UPI00242D8453
MKHPHGHSVLSESIGLRRVARRICQPVMRTTSNKETPITQMVIQGLIVTLYAKPCNHCRQI